jgi:hypothetical protein
MNKDNDGDVTSVDNQKDFEKKLSGKVDLYTSDLGFDVSSDYSKQETFHAHANLGQIITALLVLKKGGNMVTKQYSYFQPFTVSLMGLLTMVFERVEVCKPMFSKSGNSETYLIGLRYKGDAKTNTGESVIKLLLDRLSDFSMRPLITKKCLGNSFINAITKSQTYFSNCQIIKITNIISEYERIVKSKNMNRQHITNNNMFTKENIDSLKKWNEVNPLKILPRYKSLKVKEVMSRTRV